MKFYSQKILKNYNLLRLCRLTGSIRGVFLRLFTECGVLLKDVLLGLFFAFP